MFLLSESEASQGSLLPRSYFVHTIQSNNNNKIKTIIDALFENRVTGSSSVYLLHYIILNKNIIVHHTQKY